MLHPAELFDKIRLFCRKNISMFFYFLYKNKKDLYKKQKDFGETKKIPHFLF